MYVCMYNCATAWGTFNQFKLRVTVLCVVFYFFVAEPTSFLDLVLKAAIQERAQIASSEGIVCMMNKWAFFETHIKSWIRLIWRIIE